MSITSAAGAPKGRDHLIRKIRDPARKTMLIAVAVIFILLIGYRFVFGVWNPFSQPERFQVGYRRYTIAETRPTGFAECEVPQYRIKACIIRPVYSREPPDEGMPTVLYLELADGLYQAYALAGSP